ncbi:MAG: hypothetical protein P4L65_00365 [Legionella sp.]|nr:hypothetical protein [Legionella sp.]
MHLVIIALHHPDKFPSQYKRIKESTAHLVHQYEGDFKSTQMQAVNGLIQFLNDVVNLYDSNAITCVTILTDFNLGFSTTISSPIPLLNSYINTHLTDKNNQRFQTQNKSTASSASSSASAAAPSFIPVNLYFEGSGTLANPESGMPQHTVKEIMDLYGTARGDVMSFLATSRPSSRNASRNSMTSPSLGPTYSPSTSATDSRDQTPLSTIKKNSSADDTNTPQFPNVLTALSSSPIPRDSSASAPSDGFSLFTRDTSSSVSSGGSSLFPRENSSASYDFYEEFTPCSSATPNSTSALSAAFLSPNSNRGEDDEILTAVAEAEGEAEEAAIETLIALEETSAAPTTPVRKRPDHTILSFTRELHSKSPVASPVKIRPGLFGVRSSNNTPVSSPIKSGTPSPQRPVLTVEVDEVADVSKSLSQLFK